MKNIRCLFLLLNLIFVEVAIAQSFYFGSDLSYVNEMEDCGVIYQENNAPKDPYQIFADHNNNLVRLRLWHTPSWYDNLNAGKRFSDYADVQRSIQRAKDAGMQVLLDFHLSDNWADPSKQVVPKAWEAVVDDLPTLQDSLYNYVFQTLTQLNQADLLPEMVQIGNETNKGILLSPDDNAGGWMLNWNRNSTLFNKAIEAVRAVETNAGKAIKVAVHLAGPEDTPWLVEGFWDNGVQDFDIIGMSYYWAWHQPTTIDKTGDIILDLLQKYPGKEVMIFETGYIWTTSSNDNANNIISSTHPDYSPASSENQKQWLIDLTQEVINSGGLGVLYWEPAWVSSDCWTQWGQGSHQEHATFFDFDNNLIPDGGIAWMSHDYDNLVDLKGIVKEVVFKAFPINGKNQLRLELSDYTENSPLNIDLIDTAGRVVFTRHWQPSAPIDTLTITLPNLSPSIYFVRLMQQNKWMGREKVFLK